MVTGSADRTVKFWDLETFELIGSGGPEVPASFMLDSKLVAFYLSVLPFNISLFSLDVWRPLPEL